MIRRKLTAIHIVLMELYKNIRIFVTEIMHKNQNLMTDTNGQSKQDNNERRYPLRLRKKTSFYGINN